MTAVGTEPIVKEVLVEAQPETVFAFFTEPDKMTRWLCESATLDPRPGGVNHQVHRDREGRLHHMHGEFVEVSPPSRVVFSWGFEPDGGADPSTVEVTFEPADGGTLVRLVHRDLPEDARADHDAGWQTLLVERLPGAVAS